LLLPLFTIVRENRRRNEEWTIQANMSTLATEDTMKTNKTKEKHNTIQKL